MIFQIYDTNTGAILYSINTHMTNYAATFTPLIGQAIVATEANQLTEYIDVTTQTVIPRPLFNLTHPDTVPANGYSVLAITGVPVNTLVTWPDGAVTTEVDGVVELVTDTPGVLTFRFDLFPYQTKEVSIEAVDP
jgi:hypothetical protein